MTISVRSSAICRCSRRDAAQPDAADQPFVAGLDHRGQLPVEQLAVDRRRRRWDRRSSWMRRLTAASRSAPSVAQVLLDVGAQFVGLLGGQSSRPVSSRRAADLADQREVVRIGVQRLADQLVGHVGPVELRGVDVVDAQLDCAPQHGDRLVVVARRARARPVRAAASRRNRRGRQWTEPSGKVCMTSTAYGAVPPGLFRAESWLLGLAEDAVDLAAGVVDDVDDALLLLGRWRRARTARRRPSAGRPRCAG